MNVERVRKVITPLMLCEGFEIPPWYGFAYMGRDNYSAVYCVIPLNWIVRAARAIYFLLARGEREREFDHAHRMGCEKGHQRGYDIGFQRGFQQGWEDRAKEILRLLDKERVLQREKADEKHGR